MPLLARLAGMTLLAALALRAADTMQMVPAGDAGSWTTVGGVLAAVGVGSTKLLAKLQKR